MARRLNPRSNGRPVRALRVVLGDQLSHSVAALAGWSAEHDIIVMAEVTEETTHVGHHPKKIALVLSAMRHFADDLIARGGRVDYVRLDDGVHCLTDAVAAAARRWSPERIIVTAPGEWRVMKAIEGWPDATGLPVEILEDDRFICSRDAFAHWAHGRKTLRMEHFYRDMRRKTGLLMTADGKPEGGQWNFDADNRKRLPDDVDPPPPFAVRPDRTTREVLDLVAARFSGHFGALEPFTFAVTADDAEAALGHFIDGSLPAFGDYQDAMRIGADTVFHSVLSPYINIGLLDPLAVCRKVEAAYRQGRAPLNAAEGFIRQIIGWREYVRGIYWLKMPDYRSANALDARRPLPPFYWGAPTGMRCIAETVDQTRRLAYAHHIQRLMVTGNFALLAGIDPDAVNEWYLAVYADAYEWVELPNVSGMVLYADGGLLASKPYAASGKYIDRMSDYCRHCQYDVRRGTGPGACPFNYLYWSFMMRNRERLSDNPRMAMPYRTLDRFTQARREAIDQSASHFLDTMESGQW